MLLLDVRTLFVVMVATSVLLAISLWVAAGRHFRDGLGRWTVSLVLEAVMFSLFAARDEVPHWFGIIVPNAMFVACIAMQAAAILEFFGKRLNGGWYLVPLLVIIVGCGLTLDDFPARTMLSGLILGSGFLALAFLLHRLAGTSSPASGLMMSGFVAASLMLFGRAFLTAIDPHMVATSFLASGFLQSLSFLTAYAVILVTSFGFLLLHRERSESIAQRLALTDPLTGTFNRRTFLDLADKEISRSRRAGTPLSLIMLDLDHFKLINDRHGHLAGDMVLKRFSEIAQGCLRKEDLLVRFGGEEFCILLPDVSLELAYTMAERIRKAVEQTSFASDALSAGMAVTVSAGVARLKDDSMDDVVELVRCADEALYSAKSAGRNRVSAYPENSTIAMLTRSQRLRAISRPAGN
jgi:diguanylate cyclase (GGDEF)-like protein